VDAGHLVQLADLAGGDERVAAEVGAHSRRP
jgi:hypothetical protein